MPIYEFECGDCSRRFEKLAKVQEKIYCPHCNSDNLKKLISKSGTMSDDSKCNWDNPNLPDKQEFQRNKS